MKKLVAFLLLTILLMGLSINNNEKLTAVESKAIVEEIKSIVNSTDFLVDVSKSGYAEEVMFYREEYSFGPSDHYCDINLRNMKEPCYVNCGIFCCKNNWEKLDIIPVTSSMATINGILCYEIVSNHGISYCLKNSLKCELEKVNNNWKIIQN